jgi:tRNA pseudouridine38-40 synthase
MPRTVLLTLHYDGGQFAGWQRQVRARTVQGELEKVFRRLCGTAITVHGAGRTDAGVHALGMATSATIPDRWTAKELHRAINALLPDDCWAETCTEMKPGFHARKSALSRRYRYLLGTDPASSSPFRRRFEWALTELVDTGALQSGAALITGEHDFSAFSVRSSPRNHKRCRILESSWRDRGDRRGVQFDIKADRFLHHMVRMLVGTMVDIARGRRPCDDIPALLASHAGVRTSPPAPAQGLYFLAAEYPAELYA